MVSDLEPMYNEYEQRAWSALSQIQCDALLNRCDIDMIKIICYSCGWLPLENGEKCTVHYGGREYVIRRTE